MGLCSHDPSHAKKTPASLNRISHTPYKRWCCPSWPGYYAPKASCSSCSRTGVASSPCSTRTAEWSGTSALRRERYSGHTGAAEANPNQARLTRRPGGSPTFNRQQVRRALPVVRPQGWGGSSALMAEAPVMAVRFCWAQVDEAGQRCYTRRHTHRASETSPFSRE